MSRKPPEEHLLAPLSHDGPSRFSRRPVANASSTRSKSAPGSRNEISLDRNSSRPSIQKDVRDSSSQRTAFTEDPHAPASESVGATPVKNNASNNNNTNNRTDSDPSSTHSRRRDLGDWNERNAVRPRTNLTVLDVAALILNKQIGTGIFTTPGAVLASTRSKPLSVALWTIGGLWTTLFLLVYLEFGNALPFNGGELIYLDEVYRRPELLSTILFSGFFLCLANSYGNSIQFAKHVLLSAMPEIGATQELEPRLVRYIAISVITFVCLVHWFSSRAGLFLNKAVAWYKAILLLVVVVAGMTYSGKHGSQWAESENRGSADGMAGMVLIFYSYQGWENANYVAGEIRALEGRAPKRTLNIGAFLGVITVWVLYVLVAVTLYRVLSFSELTGPNSDLTVALTFAPRVFSQSLGLKICMAISAFGNVLAVTYTASKVKQSIAVQRILPFWRYLQNDKETPKGALVLHWVTSVIFIAAAPTHSDGYSFAIGIFTYGHIFFSMFVALALFGLQSRMRTHTPNYRLSFFRHRSILYTIPIVFAAGNMIILISSARVKNEGKIPRYWWPVSFICILGGSFLYWSGIRITQIRVRTRGAGVGGPEGRSNYTTIGQMIGFEVNVYNQKQGEAIDAPNNVKDSIAEALAAQIDGSQRRVEVKTSGWLKNWGDKYTKRKESVVNYFF